MSAQGSHPFYLLSYTETAPTGTNDETLLFGGGETAGEGAEGATRLPVRRQGVARIRSSWVSNAVVSECAVVSVDADENDREGRSRAATDAGGDGSDERGTVRRNADHEREGLIECAVGMMHLMRASRMALSLVAYSLRLSFRKIGRGGASCGDVRNVLGAWARPRGSR